MSIPEKERHPFTDAALIRATFCGRGNTYQADIECSTDLPADALGEVVAEVINRAWRSGEDPAGCAVTLVFYAPERTIAEALQAKRATAEAETGKLAEQALAEGAVRPKLTEEQFKAQYMVTPEAKKRGDKMVADNLRYHYKDKLERYSDTLVADTYEIFRNEHDPNLSTEDPVFREYLGEPDLPPAPYTDQEPGEHAEVIAALMNTDGEEN